MEKDKHLPLQIQLNTLVFLRLRHLFHMLLCLQELQEKKMTILDL